MLNSVGLRRLQRAYQSLTKTAKQFDSKDRIGGIGEVGINYGAHTAATLAQRVIAPPLVAGVFRKGVSNPSLFNRVHEDILRDPKNKVRIREVNSFFRGLGGLVMLGSATGAGSVQMGGRFPEVLAHEWGHLNQPRILRALGGTHVRGAAPFISALAGVGGLVGAGVRGKPEDKAKLFTGLAVASGLPGAAILANEAGATIVGHRRFKHLLGSRVLRKMLPVPLASYALKYGLVPATLGLLAARYKHLAKKQKDTNR